MHEILTFSGEPTTVQCTGHAQWLHKTHNKREREMSVSGNSTIQIERTVLRRILGCAISNYYVPIMKNEKRCIVSNHDNSLRG